MTIHTTLEVLRNVSMYIYPGYTKHMQLRYTLKHSVMRALFSSPSLVSNDATWDQDDSCIYTSVNSVGATMGQDYSYVHLQALLMQQDQAGQLHLTSVLMNQA